MVQHAVQHCSPSLKSIQFQCKAHQFKKQTPTKKSEQEIKDEQVNLKISQSISNLLCFQGKLTALEKANTNSHQTANCSDCLVRHQRIQRDRIRTQAEICFPLFTFVSGSKQKSELTVTAQKFNREAPLKSSVNTLIVGTISANYMKVGYKTLLL